MAAPKFTDVKSEYANLWRNMGIADEDEGEVDAAAENAIKNKERYQRVEKLARVPWAVIAALHMRESGADFSTYLGNGEPLTRRTRLVPKGRGPFKSWEDGAVDALRFDSLDDVSGGGLDHRGRLLRLREVQRLRLPRQENQLAVPVVEVEQLQPR